MKSIKRLYNLILKRGSVNWKELSEEEASKLEQELIMEDMEIKKQRELELKHI